MSAVLHHSSRATALVLFQLQTENNSLPWVCGSLKYPELKKLALKWDFDF